MNAKSLFRGVTSDRGEQETARLTPLPKLNGSAAGKPTGAPEQPHRRPTPWKIAVGVLSVACVALAVVSVLSLMHTSDVRDSYRNDIVDLQSSHARQMTDVRVQDARHEAREVVSAKAHQADKDARTLKKAIARERRKADRRVEQATAAARSAGYSAGSADGYNEGNADGYDEGLFDGSDSLDCSDDPDVTWLPACNW